MIAEKDINSAFNLDPPWFMSLRHYNKALRRIHTEEEMDWLESNDRPGWTKSQ